MFFPFRWLLSRAAKYKARWFGAGWWPGRYVPTLNGSTVIAWCGMRGIVTLATSYALPDGFPHRDLILLCAFTVVVGTLIAQGLTLRPLLAWLKLTHDNAVSEEIHLAKEALAIVAQEMTDISILKRLEERLSGFRPVVHDFGPCEFQGNATTELPIEVTILWQKLGIGYVREFRRLRSHP